MAEHRITINLRDGHALPEPLIEAMNVGDTVVYVTEPPNLAFRVEFVASPFSSEPSLIISDSEPRTVTEPGKFSSRCFVTGSDGNMVGWHLGEVPESGGEHDVRP